jgi:nitrogen fixation NifU-like protein
MDLKALYRDVILDHYKNPRNARELAEHNRDGRCKNPSCGDRITIQLQLSDGRVSEVGFIGVGCAISQASASMMGQAIKGQPLERVAEIAAAFREMILGRNEAPSQERLGDLVTMQGVARLHARVKCAMCGWSALEAALEQQPEEVDMTLDDSLPGSSAS